MKRWLRLLIIVGIIILAIAISLLYVEPKHTNIKDRKDVLEAVNQGEYTVFIEDKGKGAGVLKIYDSDINVEEEVEGIAGNLHGIKWSNDGRYFAVIEGKGIVGITYIISVENREDIASIRTAGETIWSLYSSKLLIGVENHQKRSIDLINYYVACGT